jgi:stage IV sporulation protein B
LQNLKTRKIIGLVIAATIIFVSIALDICSFYDFPDEVRIIKGRQQRVELKIPMTFELLCDQKENLVINGFPSGDKINLNLKEPLILQSSAQGIFNLKFKLFGVIPVKKMRVFVIPEKKVIPGGHSLGVKLRPEGVIVVGFASVIDENGHRNYPAQDSGIQVGDTIIMLNNKKIFGADDLAQAVNNSQGNPINLTIKRHDKTLDLTVKAIKNNTNDYQIGLWVRDIAAGVGTLTFYDPDTGFYGALGHIISDADTGKVIEVGEGGNNKVTSNIHIPG